MSGTAALDDDTKFLGSTTKSLPPDVGVFVKLWSDNALASALLIAYTGSFAVPTLVKAPPLFSVLNVSKLPAPVVPAILSLDKDGTITLS